MGYGMTVRLNDLGKEFGKNVDGALNYVFTKNSIVNILN